MFCAALRLEIKIAPTPETPSKTQVISSSIWECVSVVSIVIYLIRSEIIWNKTVIKEKKKIDELLKEQSIAYFNEMV